jgi:hypothetical protein
VSDPRLARPLWRGRTNVDALTIACIEHAEQIVRDERPDIAHLFTVTQGGYQIENPNREPDSGTTHLRGGGTDLSWCGHPFCYLALRRAGMFIWHRTPKQGPWRDHFHGAPLGHPFMDPALEAQEDSYLARGNGLGGEDDGPRLNPIPRPVWPWPQEDDMPYRDWPDADRKALVEDIVAGLLNAQVDDDPKFNVKQALRRVGQPEKE